MSPNESTDGDEGSLQIDDLLDVEPLRAFPWLEGIITGVTSWAMAYGLFASLFYVGPASLDVASQSTRLKLIGHLFYNAHLVDRIVTAPLNAAVPGGRQANFLFEPGMTTQLPLPVYLAVPIIALIVASVVFGAVKLGPSSDYADAGLVGVAMALGYVVLGVLGTYLFTTTASGGISRSPDLIQTVVFFSAYPFFLGTLGALVGSHYERE